ncbi:MAG: flagellar motor protein MotB [Thalassobaculaceae bacterium]|nr:flagellar motor protein MotB [Thalassobaculaceae bacterium]
MTFSRSERRDQDKGSSQPLFLSLFLLLLAFFIMLNAMSTVEQGRSDKVLESVKRAFPSALRKDIADDLLDAEPGKVIGESVRAALGTVFREVLPAIAVEVEADGNPIFVSIPGRRVYAPAAGGITPVMEELAGRLAPILNNPPAGSVLDLQILYGIGSDTDLRTREELIFRASETVRVFVEHEVDPAILSAGLEPRDPEFVRLVFRTRPAGRVGPDLEGGAS